jgi:hypothetical protein
MTEIFLPTFRIQKIVLTADDSPEIILQGHDLHRERLVKLYCRGVVYFRIETRICTDLELLDFRVVDIRHCQQEYINYRVSDDSPGDLQIDCSDVQIEEVPKSA